MRVDFSFLYRKKQVDEDGVEETKLARVLNTLDLTALGTNTLKTTVKERIFIFILFSFD
jgi:hypothetical protein